MWKVFLSHASEDKEAVRPIVEALEKAGHSVWFDEHALKLGDLLRQKIDEGLAKCQFGVVFLSEAFLSKQWTQTELDGLAGLEKGGRKVILPIWHEVTEDFVRSKSPILASRLGISTSEGNDKIVRAILDVIDPGMKSVYTKNETTTVTHVIENIDSLSYRKRKNKSDEYEIFDKRNYKCRILHFKKGQKIRDHGHTTGPLYKIILKGKILYNEKSEQLEEFQLAFVKDNVEYDGDVVEDTYMLLMEPSDSEIYDPQK